LLDSKTIFAACEQKFMLAAATRPSHGYHLMAGIAWFLGISQPSADVL
jgi:hypothetical protein